MLLSHGTGWRKGHGLPTGTQDTAKLDVELRSAHIYTASIRKDLHDFKHSTIEKWMSTLHDRCLGLSTYRMRERKKAGIQLSHGGKVHIFFVGFLIVFQNNLNITDPQYS